MLGPCSKTAAGLLGALVVGLVSGEAPSGAQTVERDVYVTVLDRAGAPIGGLTAEYFAVREDGKDRQVVRVAPSAAPMHVAVVVDTSLGRTVLVEPFTAAIGPFMESLAANHQVALYATGDHATRMTPFTRDAALLRSALNGMFARNDPGSSRLLDGIELACRDLRDAAPARPVVVVVSTESPESSGRSSGSAIKMLIERAAVLHAVVYASATGNANRTASRINPDVAARKQSLEAMMAVSEGDRERDRFLREGAQKTGGGVIRVTVPTGLPPALAQVAGELGAAYRLTFARPAGEKPSKDLQVGVFLDDVQVRATAVPPPK
jgi:VWFA-related protein